MARGYRMTPKRRAALKRAQAISARKRRGKGRGKLASANRRITRQKRVAVAIGALAGIGAAAYLGSRHRSNRTIAKSVPQHRTTSLVRSSSKIDKDSIPLYNPKANKNWPHVGADVARKKNKKLRKRGLIE